MTHFSSACLVRTLAIRYVLGSLSCEALKILPDKSNFALRTVKVTGIHPSSAKRMIGRTSTGAPKILAAILNWIFSNLIVWFFVSLTRGNLAAATDRTRDLTRE